MSDHETITCLPHEQRDVLVERAREHLKNTLSPSSLIYVIPTKRMAQRVEMKLTDGGGFVPLIGTPISVAMTIFDRAFPGIPVLSTDMERIALERALDDVWDNLEYFALGRDRPSQGLVNQLYGLFRRARARRIDLDAELSGSEKAKDRDIARVFARYLEIQRERGMTDTVGTMERLIESGASAVEGVELVLLDTLTHMPTPVERDFIAWLSSTAERSVSRDVRVQGMVKVFGEDAAVAATLDGSIGGGLSATLFRKPTADDPDASLKDHIVVIEGPERTGELEAVASSVRDLLDGGTPPSSISVVLSDTMAYDTILGPVFEAYGVPVDLRAPHELMMTGPGRAVAALLTTALGDLPRQTVIDLVCSPYIEYTDPASGVRLDPGFLGRIAKRSAFTGGRNRWSREIKTVREKAERRAKSTGLDEDERRAAKRYATYTKEQEACANGFLDVVSSIAAEGACTEREFASIVRNALKRLGVRERALSGDVDLVRRDGAALRRLDGALDTLGSVGDVLGECQRKPDQHVATLIAVASGSRFSIEPRRSDAVQVMGLWEAQGWENDHVFVCGLSEKDIPRPTAAGALLPFDERVRDLLTDRVRDPGTREVLRPERDMALQRYRFLMAATSARERLYLSRPTTVGEKETIASIFLDEVARRFEVTKAEPPAPRTTRDLLVVAGDVLGRSGRDPSPALLRLARELRNRALLSVKVERIERMKSDGSMYSGVLADAATKSAVEAFFADHHYSATEIETYCKCPFSYMARYVMGLREDEDPTAHVTGLTLGNVIHQALFNFLSTLRDRGALPMTVDKKDLYRTLLRDEVRSAIERLGGESLSWEVLPDALLANGGALDRWIDTEIETVAPFGGLGPSHFELAFGPTRGERDPASTDEPVVLSIDGKNIPFVGKIDRIDIDKDGRLVLFDYKTGKGEGARPADIVNGYSIQLALYPQLMAAAAKTIGKHLPSEPLASALYRVSPRAPMMRKVLSSDEAFDDIKSAGSTYTKDPTTAGVIKCYQKYDKDGDKVKATLENVQAEVNERIAEAVKGMTEGRFPSSPGDPGAHCLYCLARHVCRNRDARVARSW